MRILHLLAVPLLASLAVLPASAPAQARISVTFGARLGPEVHFSAYSRERQGDWRDSYRRWTPVTLYDINGRYYRNNIRGARPIQVYSYNGEYFLPPQDQGWRGTDRRYDNRRQPSQDDYGRMRPFSGEDRPDKRLGIELGVLAYSPARAGEWRSNIRRWTPVTLFEVNGRYYPNDVQGARRVSMYRYHDEYFLPPDDQAWEGADKRFDYRNRPNRGDFDRARHMDPEDRRTP